MNFASELVKALFSCELYLIENKLREFNGKYSYFIGTYVDFLLATTVAFTRSFPRYKYSF